MTSDVEKDNPEGLSSLGGKLLALPLTRHIRRWAGILISLFFFYLIARTVETRELGAVLLSATYGPLIPSIVVYFIGVVLRSFRWIVLCKPLTRISFTSSLRVIAIGYMANNLLPLRAGEFYRAHVLGSEYGISRTAVLSTIVLERVFDGLAMLFFLAMTWVLLPSPRPVLLTSLALFSSILFLGLTLLFLMIARYPRLVVSLNRLIGRMLPHRFAPTVMTLVENAANGLMSLRGASSFTGILLLSLGAWFSEALMYFILFSSFAISAGYGVALLLVAVVNLGIMIPASPGYIGTFEFFCAQTLGFVGVDSTTAFSYALFLHAALFLPITLLGLLFFWQSTAKMSGTVDSVMTADQDGSQKSKST